MSKYKNVENIMGWILNIGTLLATIVVLIGGLFYLIESGHQPIKTLLQHHNATTIQRILQNALSFSPLGIIMFGLFMLVLTQILRVALLAWYYVVVRDIWFSLFSFFILLTLIFSLFYRSL